jgi:hypothetical protein
MWLTNIYNYIGDLSVSVARPINPVLYLKPIAMIGNGWLIFASTAFALGFIYIIAFIIVAQQNLVIRFKDTIKWW